MGSIGTALNGTRAVFFDRDGVINRAMVRAGKPYPPPSLAALQLEEDVAGTLAALRGRGYTLFVFTNQPDVARGTQTRENVEEIHEFLQRQLPLERIYACFHDDGDDCACRKPRPGMIFQARDRYQLDLSESWVVGDRWRDIEAGIAAGCRTIHLQRDYDEKCPQQSDHTIYRLSDVLTWIV